MNETLVLRLENGDLDGDGDADIAAVLGQSVWWMEQTAPAVFAPASYIAAPIMGTGGEIRLYDLDNDDDLDLVGASSFTDQVFWCENIGGAFLPSVDIAGFNAANAAFDLQDIDSNGWTDVVYTSALEHGVYASYQSPDGTWSPRELVVGGLNEVRAVTCRDFNQDGLPDVVAHDDVTHRVYAVMQSATGWNAPVQISDDGFGLGRISSADINGDGYPEVVAHSRMNALWIVWSNHFSETLSVADGLAPTVYNGDVWFGLDENDLVDINGDDAPDMFLGGTNDDIDFFTKLSWYPNDGEGNFGPEQTISVTPDLGFWTPLTAMDVDQDGATDVIAVDDGVLVWYRNTCVTPGCTDATACNFNPDADFEDGSCTGPLLYMPDADGDGFGAEDLAELLCDPGEGWTTVGGDCNDANDSMYPGAIGTGTDIDNDCNGEIASDESTCPVDVLGDGGVDAEDLLLMMAFMGTPCDGCAADIDGSGNVDTVDLLLLIVAYGTPCPDPQDGNDDEDDEED